MPAFFHSQIPTHCPKNQSGRNKYVINCGVVVSWNLDRAGGWSRCPCGVAVTNDRRSSLGSVWCPALNFTRRNSLQLLLFVVKVTLVMECINLALMLTDLPGNTVNTNQEQYSCTEYTTLAVLSILQAPKISYNVNLSPNSYFFQM